MSLSASDRVDPADVLDRAIDALNNKEPELPLRDVEAALAKAPNDHRLWHVKGLIHREQDRRELAIPALHKAIELAPNDPLVAHGYARTLLEAGQPSAAAFARSLKLAPGDPDLIKGLAAALVAEGRTGDAIEGVQAVLRGSPLWTEGHQLLASLRWSEGNHEGFTLSLDEALAQHPASADLRRIQLNALVEAEQFDDALSRIEEGRARYGEQLVFTTHEAVIRSETGDTKAADLLFEQVPMFQLANFDVRRVRHWLRTGRVAQAIELLDWWIDRPEQENFWPYAASAWRLAGDPRSDWLEGDDRIVGTYDIADRLPPLDDLAATLRKVHKMRAQPFGQSVRGGTQTDGHLFQRVEPEIVVLREAIRETVADHARNLPPLDSDHPTARKRPDRIAFSGAWSVRLAAGGNHANHVHPMGWLSSALYIVLPPDLGHDDAGWLTLGEPQAQLQLGLPPRRMIEPQVGRLALFPSWMWHGTRPFGEGERMTVAFDVAPAPPGERRLQG